MGSERQCETSSKHRRQWETWGNSMELGEIVSDSQRQWETVRALSHYCWLYLAVCSSSIELMHVSHCLQWLPAFSHCLFQFHGVAACLSLSLIVSGFLSLSVLAPWSCCISSMLADSHYLFQHHRVAVCLSQSPIFSVCLSISLPELCIWERASKSRWQCEKFSKSMGTKGIVRESMQQWGTVRDI